MSRLRRTVVQAARTLWRAKGFSVVAVVTLALGMGTAVTMFALVNGVLLRPLPYRDADRLVNVERRTPQGPAGGLDIASMDDFASGSRAVEAFAAYRSLGQLDVGGLNGPESVAALEVTSTFLDVLGSHPARGANFSRDHERGDSGVVILTHNGWTRLFARDPSVVGRALRVNGRTATVIGVTSPDLELPRNSGAALLVPLDRTGQQVDYGRIGHRCIARMKVGVTRDSLERDLERIARDAAKRNPAARVPEGWSMSVTGYQQALLGERRLVTLMMLGASMALLAMACANVANLFLLRAYRKRQDNAIRAALGAEAGDLLADSLAEGTLVGLAGTILGLALAKAGVHALPIVLESFSNVNGIRRLDVDLSVCGFALAVAFLTSVVFALVPTLHGNTQDPNLWLRAGDPRSGRGGHRYRTLLLVSQAAMAGLLIATAGLFVRSLTNALAVDQGFDSRDVLAVRLYLPEGRYPTLSSIARFQGELQTRLTGLPGVQAVTGALFTPLEGDEMSVFCAGLPVTRPMGQWNRCVLDGVSDGYFAALRIPIVLGRETRRGEAGVAVVNETLARRLFPGSNPVGQTIRLPLRDPVTGGPHRDVRVVGVSKDCRNLGLTAAVLPRVSLPFDRFADSGFSLLVRSPLPPERLRRLVDPQVRSLDPLLPIREIVPLRALAGDSVSDLREHATLLATFTVFGLVVVALGIYTVVAAAVSQRTREIGIRMALGASTRRVLGMVLAQGAVPLAVGSLGGGVAAVMVGHVARHQLFGLTPADPVTLAVGALLLAAVGGVACVLPARRAIAVDPAITLRDA